MAYYSVTEQIEQVLALGYTPAEIKDELGYDIDLEDGVWLARARTGQYRVGAWVEEVTQVRWVRNKDTAGGLPEWLIRGVGLQVGQTVTVTRRNGTTSREYVQKIVKTEGHVVTAVAGKEPPAEPAQEAEQETAQEETQAPLEDAPIVLTPELVEYQAGDVFRGPDGRILTALHRSTAHQVTRDDLIEYGTIALGGVGRVVKATRYREATPAERAKAGLAGTFSEFLAETARSRAESRERAKANR